MPFKSELQCYIVVGIVLLSVLNDIASLVFIKSSFNLTMWKHGRSLNSGTDTFLLNKSLDLQAITYLLR